MPLNDHNNIELVPTATNGTGPFVAVLDKKKPPH